MSKIKHPLDQLDSAEIRTAASAVRESFADDFIRFSYITLSEPPKKQLAKFRAGDVELPRYAHVCVMVPATGLAHEILVALPSGEVHSRVELPPGTQPVFTPDDGSRAEEIVKKDAAFAELMKERYGIQDMAHVVCDPWSVHVACPDYPPLHWREGIPARLVQSFLYRRDDELDNCYAHPIDIVPIVDINAEKVIAIEGTERPPPKIPDKSVNYHRNKIASNDYLETKFRENLAPLEITQPEGPSFSADGSLVNWQKWSLRIGFNYREGLVLHEIKYSGRSIVARASLVEMIVPYADPHTAFARKNAFDVSSFGLGYCTNSLQLGCDCKGAIRYFDAVLADGKGDPYIVEKAICMHEEDAGLLWKHVEYRTGHSESRRSRRLVISCIMTVVNYEYAVYFYFYLDGSIEYEVRLSGELSTNLLSEEETTGPLDGVIVAPGVNAQLHQHNFCVRLDMAVDGDCNSISEVDVRTVPMGKDNPYGNRFRAVTTLLENEHDAQRVIAPGRTWKIFNSSSRNAINGKPVSYKLIPYSIGPSMPCLLTAEGSSVSNGAVFATKNLWVTRFSDKELYPAGDYPTQTVKGGDGLPIWTAANRSVENCDIVLWHSFSVVHVPSVEQFPVMTCEMTGFTLKPDGFFNGNPAIDVKPSVDEASKCCA